MRPTVEELDGQSGESARPPVEEDRSGIAADQPRPGSGRLRGAVRTTRPLLFAAAVGLVVLVIHVLSVLAHVNPYSGRTQYGLHVAPLVVAAVAVGAAWWARRRGQTWDADLVPALFGGVGALTMLTALHGTPFDIAGLSGDQSYRTENVTRFADSWWGGDYTYRGRPAYYAPAFFWVLGRTAALTGTAPWHMLKAGTVAVAFLAPVVSYLLWRRVVPPRVAALISAVPLIVPGLDESYAWLVQVAFIPWWLEAGHGLTRRGVRRWHPVTLGLVGAVLFTTYYYYFYLLPIAFGLYLVVERWRGELSWREARRTLAVLGVAALGSAPFWAPLAWDLLTAPEFAPLNNRWMTLNSGRLALPMLEPSVLGVLCLTGLAFLVVTAKEALSRALLILLVSLYAWHAVGFPFLVIDEPLMSFRMRELTPLVLLAAAAVGLARATTYAAQRLPADTIARLTVAGAALLAVFAGDHFVTTVTGDNRVMAAHNQPLPGGQLPAFHDATAKPSPAPPERDRAVIDATYAGAGHPVVLTDRSDLLALYPYYGFVQWNANYSHPTAQFRGRMAFLDELARSRTPAEFAGRVDDNPYDRIDVLVLQYDQSSLVFRTRDDAFPFGTKLRQVVFPVALVQPQYFQITKVDGYLVAVRRR
jgi:galactan 5-O-arabinofuranosyltransferase